MGTRHACSLRYHDVMTDVAHGRPLADLLEDFALSREDLEEVMRRALEQASFERYAPTTAREQELLLSDSGLGDEGLQVLRSGMSRGPDVIAAAEETAEHARVVGESVSMEEAAEILGRSLSTLSRSASEGRLMSFRLGGRVRYPLWQFHDGKSLPGLPKVVTALPASWRPRKVMAVMSAPAEALDGMTPVQWLAEAGDPDLVVGLIEDLDRG